MMILESDAKRPSSVACYEGEVLCIAMYFVGVRQFRFSTPYFSIRGQLRLSCAR